jgi:UDP-N-acetyl-D-glucosamine dehydrogenase
MAELSSSPVAQQFQAKLESQQTLVGIIGLGYVGLPLAQAFIAGGYKVLGFDIDPVKIDKLTKGESYIGHIDSATIQQMRNKGLSATADFKRLNEPDAILICVPTPLTTSREPDLTYVENSARAIAEALRLGQLIVLESTTYPGTTRRVVKPILERKGLTSGKDFFLAFSPEREDPGNKNFSAPTIPKVVGGIDPISGALANKLYGKVVKSTVPVGSAEVAEASKILENTYRAVNIALVNELKMLYDKMGIDVWEVIEAAKTKPFGYQAFYPGPGLGGHCIPIDPFYLTWIAREFGQSTRFIELAGEINTSMPHYVVTRLGDALNDRSKPIKGSNILMLGMAYKKDVDDPRESPGFELMELLLQKGAKVKYNDPHIPTLPPMRHYPGLRMESSPLEADLLSGQDVVLVVTDHTAYDWNFIVQHSPLVIDTRNACKNVTSGREKIVKA